MRPFPTGPVSVLIMMGGLIVWSSAFVALYGGMSLACVYGVPDFTWAGLHGINWALLLLLVLHLALLGWMTWYSWRGLRRLGHDAPRSQRFAWRTTYLLNVAGLFGTAWIGFPILFIVPCA